MIIYFETSVLVKCYLDEPESGYVNEIMEGAEFRITSALTQLELVSAIEFAKHIRRINSPVYREKSAALNADVGAERVVFLSITPSILKRAIPLIRVHRLKSPDAIQLATALNAQKEYQGDIQFLCADRALLGAARREGLRCKDASR